MTSIPIGEGHRFTWLEKDKMRDLLTIGGSDLERVYTMPLSGVVIHAQPYDDASVRVSGDDIEHILAEEAGQIGG